MGAACHGCGPDVLNRLPNPVRRRALMGAGIGAAIALPLGAEPSVHKPIVFPRDAGSHPDHAIEWWYVTGYTVDGKSEAAFGFQVTFFRSRIPKAQNMQSGLAARQLIFAHAALTDLTGKKLWHDQRMARSSGAEP